MLRSDLVHGPGMPGVLGFEQDGSTGGRSIGFTHYYYYYHYLIGSGLAERPTPSRGRR